jgi:hypothetical protein
MKIFTLILTQILFTFVIQSCSEEPKEELPNKNNVVLDEPILLPFESTNDLLDVKLKIKEKKFDKYNKLVLRFETAGIELGLPSQNEQSKGVVYSKDGAYLCIIFDGKLIQKTNLLDSIVIPKIYGGSHFLNAFICRSWGESLKNNESNITDSIGVEIKTVDKKKTIEAKNSISINDSLIIDSTSLNDPFIFICSPNSEQFSINEGNNILLDFQCKNVVLSDSNFKIRVSIDGKNLGTIYDNKPRILAGTRKGVHLIKLELLTSEGKIAHGKYAVAERSFQITN